jgi:hypothetical protein
MKRHTLMATAVAVVSAIAVAMLQTGAPQAQADLTTRLPAGPVLVLQATDLSSIVSDWNTSSEKTAWLGSTNYNVFASSRLFLRLKDAYSEFAEASGVPPDMSLLGEIAGKESVLGLYDIGKLEFLYLSRLPASNAMENALWRHRGNYQPREVAGTPFYVRSDPASGRLVAFAARDGYLFVATREDLIANALTLAAEGAGASVASEGWFQQAVAAQPQRGELRLVTHLQALARQPHFRSYWIQRNVSELGQYLAGVSDLSRTPTGLTESRVLVRAQTQTLAAHASSLGDLVRLVPETAGLYRAWTDPADDDAVSLIVEKLLSPGSPTSRGSRMAPTVAVSDSNVGGEGDFESRIDEPPPPGRTTALRTDLVSQWVSSSSITGLLQVESTRPGADGVFVDRGAVLVFSRSEAWALDRAQTILRDTLAPARMKGDLGASWKDTMLGGERVSQFDTVVPLFAAVRGNLLFLGDDPRLLGEVLARIQVRPEPLEGRYAGGFRHGRERDRFVRLAQFVDRLPTIEGSHEPLFLSENVASLSATLARVDSVSVTVRNTEAQVVEKVHYSYAR